jgi:hypothetical protein
MPLWTTKGEDVFWTKKAFKVVNGNWEDDSVRDSNLNIKVARTSFTDKRNKNR